MRHERHTSTTKAIAGGALAIALVVLLVFIASRRAVEPISEKEPTEVTSPAEPVSDANPAFIFGRVSTNETTVYEGRLRFGGDEEAFWGEYFNGTKLENPWIAQVPPEELRERRPVKIFGVELLQWEQQVEVAPRPFMVRFGDITRIESNGRDLRVTLKSGTVFPLDLFGADDFADGVRIWDGKRGVVNLDERQIRSIDLLASSGPSATPDRLHGTVRTHGGNFTGFMQWDRQKGVGSDELSGITASGERSMRFNTIRSIVRNGSNSSLVTLLDGEEIDLTYNRDVGPGTSGIYVDDRRYGRVLISWDVFERVDFSSGGSGPAYGDFPAGRSLTGAVTTRDGRRLAGRLVYDLDESETTETLDAPAQGVDYTILFALIASIELPAPEQRAAGRAKMTLHSGEVLNLELGGDLGETNAGMLIFAEGRKQPEYVGWKDIKEIRLDRPPATYPLIESR